ncbi:MAG: bifunctional DNA-formamidopyrimidine glycosylase/DNA-(apurinic or apyrimidinic site) lyase [Planctomycetota bacterium]
MPELPEVECIRRGLEGLLVGRAVRLGHLGRNDIVGSLEHPRGQRGGRALPVPAESLLDGCVVDRVLRKGKQLAIGARSGRWLIVRLGMSGQLLSGDLLASKKDHVHIHWFLNDGTSLAFRDARRFGSVIPCDDQDALDVHWRLLGPDALSVEPHDLLSRLRPKRTALKTCLMDQSVLAGVGNIYADESLFGARLHPLMPASRLQRGHVDRLVLSLRKVLVSAINHGGSTLRDFCTPSGVGGTYRSAHQVYGRKGEPCPTCRVALRGARIGGRASVWCPTCQDRRIRSVTNE